jgi:hypothetical protein
MIIVHALMELIFKIGNSFLNPEKIVMTLALGS